MFGSGYFFELRSTKVVCVILGLGFRVWGLRFRVVRALGWEVKIFGCKVFNVWGWESQGPPESQTAFD